MLTTQDTRETDQLKDELLRSLLARLDERDTREPVWLPSEDLRALLALAD